MKFVPWLFTGGAVGVLNGLILWWTAARLRPSAPRRAVTWALGGAMLRWGLAAGLLISALRQGIVACLVAFAGLWLTRWGMACWLVLGQKSSDLFDS
jgi:hypothetical protein